METVLPSAQVFFHQNHSYCTLKKVRKENAWPWPSFLLHGFRHGTNFSLVMLFFRLFEKTGIIYMEVIKESDLKNLCIKTSATTVTDFLCGTGGKKNQNRVRGIFPLPEAMETLGTVRNKHYAIFLRLFIRKLE